MGLDTSHGCWSGPYSSFTRWRNEVAVAAGYGLMKWGEPPGVDMPNLPWDDYEERNYSGEWDAPPSDPLVVLLAHSDCEGEIRPEHCLPLAERLEEIAPLLPDEPAWHRGEGARAKALQFAKGLREAAAAGEPVEFH